MQGAGKTNQLADLMSTAAEGRQREASKGILQSWQMPTANGITSARNAAKACTGQQTCLPGQNERGRPCPGSVCMTSGGGVMLGVGTSTTQ